jgi:dihydropteroate synthase
MKYHKAELFKSLELPLLIGISKSMIYKELNSTKEANGTTVLNTVALTKGANILGARCESCRVCATVD